MKNRSNKNFQFNSTFTIFSKFCFYFSKPKSHAQILSEAMVDYLVSKTNGLKLDVEVAMAAFLNKERKKKKPFPWKVDLEIGNSVKIPVVAYIHVSTLGI